MLIAWLSPLGSERTCCLKVIACYCVLILIICHVFTEPAWFKVTVLVICCSLFIWLIVYIHLSGRALSQYMMIHVSPLTHTGAGFTPYGEGKWPPIFHFIYSISAV